MGGLSGIAVLVIAAPILTVVGGVGLHLYDEWRVRRSIRRHVRGGGS